MKYTKEVYDRLIRGKFISSDSIDENQRNWYRDVESEYEAYADYYSKIGYTLELENGYCYFSKEESNSEYERKLRSLCTWIDYLDLLKSLDGGFCRGFKFRRYELERHIQSDVTLVTKAISLAKDNSVEKAVDSIIAELISADFLECINETDGIYRVTAAFGYIENVINSLTIEKSVENEIPE